MQTLLRILDKVKQLGNEYHCFHQEIPPTGAGTRRYMLMKIIEPIKNPKEDFFTSEFLNEENRYFIT